MQLLVSCDFLVAPATCESAEMALFVESLIAIRRGLENKSTDLIIEEDATSKLTEQGFFPCAQLFSGNLTAQNSIDYSGRDIARTVNNILSMQLNDDNCAPYCIADWTHRSATPIVLGRTDIRTKEIATVFEEVSLAMRVHQREISVLHHPVTPGWERIAFSGMVERIEPVTSAKTPFEVAVEIPLHQSYKEYLLSLDAFLLYEAAVTAYEVKLAIFVGALSALSERGMNTDLQVWDTFSLGDEFIASLKAHQGYAKQNFAGTCFDAIRHVVARVEKYENKPFYKNIDRKEQRSEGGKLAWRTHITKGAQALRLMYWIDKEGCIELANVGNKAELEIL